MLTELGLMDGKDIADFYPDPGFHFESSRNALRRRFMIFRAISMLSSNAGSPAVTRKPPGAGVRRSVSPFSTFRAVRASLGRMTPRELPICVILTEMVMAPPML